jgi:hypothetical protein
MLMSRLIATKSFRSGHFVNSTVVNDRPNNWTATRRLSGEIAPPTCRQGFFFNFSVNQYQAGRAGSELRPLFIDFSAADDDVAWNTA